MAKPVFNDALIACFDAIHTRLFEANQIAKAAKTYTVAGSLPETVTISMNIEQLIYEAGRLQDAASLLNKLSSD